MVPLSEEEEKFPGQFRGDKLFKMIIRLDMVDYWEGWVVLGGLQKFWVVFGGLKSFLVFQILKACVNYCLSAASPAREWAKWLNSVHVLTLGDALATSFVHIFYDLFQRDAPGDEIYQQIPNSKSNL